MVDVICDTSFLIHLATTRIKNLDSLTVEIGHLEFAVPDVARNELERLLNTKKTEKITATLDLIKDLKTVPISGTFADKELLAYARENHCMIGTMDRKLKKQIKSSGGSVLSFSNDRIVLEPQ